MSNEKKNKGRDPAARINDSPASRLVQKFLEMAEVDFVRNVVVPVLEAEGYERIDFHHGATEVGKDLIFSKDKGFGKKSLVAAVVKSDRLTKSSSGASGLPVILVQVDQAKRNEVISWDGTKQRPDKVLVILADDPSHDVINSNPGGFQDRLTDGVEFILGTDIATSLLKHRKDIAEQILESKLDTSVFLERHPTNLPLLHALHSNELVDIQSIFTDLDAAVGATTISHALSLRPSGTSKILVPKSAWPTVSNAIREMEKNLGAILTEPLEVVENKYNKTTQKAQSPKNKNIWDGLVKTANDIQNWITTLCQDIEERNIAINYVLQRYPKEKLLIEALKISTAITDGAESVLKTKRKIQKQKNVSSNTLAMCNELEKFRNTIEISHNQLSKKIDKANSISLTTLTELSKSIEREFKNSQDVVIASKKMLGEAKRYVPAAIHEVEFDVAKLRQKIEARLESLVNRFKSEKVSTDRNYSRSLLEDVRQYLAAIDSFVSTTELAPVLKVEQVKGESTYNLSACILGLLNSGVDVLVTGNAGSGKSTTLEMFARQHFDKRDQNEQVIFLPLAKLANADLPSLTDDPLNYFYNEVTKLFHSTQPGVTNKFVKEQIVRSSYLVLVLDGIDEASQLIDWILKLIEGLKKLKGNDLQIVASSRFGVAELERAGLFRIQLLPFRHEQVIRFVDNFLSKEPKLV